MQQDQIDLGYRPEVSPETSKNSTMRCAPRRCYINACVAIAGASLIAVPPVESPTPAVQVRAVQLTTGYSADSLLGDGTALVRGGSGIPIPPERYVDAADTLYLQPARLHRLPASLDHA